MTPSLHEGTGRASRRHDGLIARRVVAMKNPQNDKDAEIARLNAVNAADPHDGRARDLLPTI
jgi:hypothetical protein